MSKKSQLKRKKYQYTKTEFILVVCNKCGLCESKINPVFCYDGIYLDEPKKFIKTILPKLIETKKWFDGIGYNNINICPDDDIQHILITSFCKSNYCGNWMGDDDKCDYLAGCLSTIRKQFSYSSKNNDNIISYQALKSKYKVKLGNKSIACGYSSKKNKIKKEKEPERHPTPSFFCSEGFENRIKSIIYGNDNRKQDKIKRRAGFITRFVDRESENTESEISGSTISGEKCVEHPKDNN